VKKTLPLIALVLVATCLVQVAVESPGDSGYTRPDSSAATVPEVRVPMPQPPREAVRVPSLSPVDRAKCSAGEVFRDGITHLKGRCAGSIWLVGFYVTGDRPSWFAFSSTAPQAAK